MGTEVVPEVVLRAFIRTYPDLFLTQDLSYLGLIPDSEFGWPIDFSRNREVKHLGGMSALGINCASCHFVQITSASTPDPIRILGGTSHFNVEAFFGSVLVATFKTSDPANMKRFLSAYLSGTNPKNDAIAQPLFGKEWQRQEQEITTAISADPFGSKNIEVGDLHTISPGALLLDEELLDHHLDLAALSHTMLKLFHNMRAALHVPDQPPEKAPPASGPFHRGSRSYDTTQMGYTDEGAYVIETTTAGNANSGHDYGTNLSIVEKSELMEYLKTL